MPAPLPPGRFRDAIVQRGYGILSWVFGLFSVLLLVLFVPWARVFEGNADPAIAPRAWEVVSKGQPLELWPFAFLFFGLLFLIAFYGLWRGLVSAFAPRGSSPARALVKIGDPTQVLAAFEAEARAPAFDVARPRILITRSWLLFGDSIQVNLVPLKDVLWAYGKQGKTGHVVAGLMSVAGVIDSRQRQLATRFDDPDELDLVLHVRNEDEPIRLNVKAALDDVLDHLLVHAPHMVIGHDAHLAELWKADPETFARHGRALGGVQAPRPAASADDTPYGTLFGPAMRPVQAPD